MSIFYFLIQPFVIILSFGLFVLSDVARPRGVSEFRAAIYTPNVNGTFLCEDGTKSIKYIQVNDDFCDCPDGTDEPGTSACPNIKFHCVNLGHRPQNIPSSRVNDGICDCCDGSDEYDSNIECDNNCSELGQEERKREEYRKERVKRGATYRADLINRGKSLKEERLKKISELRNRKTESESIREEKETRKKEAETVENEALQVYREIQETSNREKLEREASENRKEAEDIFTKFDSNRNGFIEIVEIQTRVAFDKDRDGVVTVEEAQFFLDERERVDLETFVTFAWPRIKPYLMLDSGLFKPPPTGNEDDKKTEIEEIESVDEGHTDLELEEKEKDEIRDDDTEGHEGDEDEEDDHNDGDVEDTDFNTETTTVKPQEYDPETQKLIEEANAARNDYLEADRIVREIDNEIKDLEELIAKDYGPEEEYASLDGECFTFEDREYVYKLCPFDRTSQQPRSGGSETRLGTWERWNGNDENKYSQMLYSNGAPCWNGPQRSAAVSVECGLENKITSVSEPSRCEYHFGFQTPAACYPIGDSSGHDFHDEL